METITVYKANDGSRFDSEKQCGDHERICATIESLESEHLKPVPDTCDFQNGGGYVQQTSHGRAALEKSIRKLAAEILGDSKFKTSSLGWLIRILSDSDDPSANRLHFCVTRLYCMDDKHREWGQPYYAAHPTEGKQKLLN